MHGTKYLAHDKFTSRYGADLLSCVPALAVQAVYDDTHTRLTCVKVSPSTGRYILTAGADAGVKALELQTLGNGYPRPIGSVTQITQVASPGAMTQEGPLHHHRTIDTDGSVFHGDLLGSWCQYAPLMLMPCDVGAWQARACTYGHGHRPRLEPR